MSAVLDLIAMFQEDYIGERLSPLVTIRGDTKVVAGYHAQIGRQYDAIDDDYVQGLIDDQPWSQLDLDVPGVTSYTHTGGAVFITQDVTARSGLPAGYLDDVYGCTAAGASTRNRAAMLYLGSLVRVKQARDEANAPVLVSQSYISAMTGRKFVHSDAGSPYSGLTYPAGAEVFQGPKVTITPDGDGVAEVFVGPYDQRGVQTKFWSPALLLTSWTDAADDGARTYVDEAHYKLAVQTVDGANVQIEHAFSTVPTSFLKAAALLHFGVDGARALMELGGGDSVIGAEVRVGSDLSTSDIWALCTGGAPQQGFLKSVLQKMRGA